MSESMDRVLKECVSALKPYLDQLVLAGGWVPYVYSKMYLNGVAQDPLLTRDFDAVVPRHGFREPNASLNAIIKDAGYEYEFASISNPPVVKYVKTLSDKTKVEIEFITDEPGNREGVKEIGSISAQALRNVGILTDNPWKLDLSEHGLAEDSALLVPRPANYLLHKTLVAPQRRNKEKTAKDLYYMFYVLEAFPVWKAEIFVQIGELVTLRSKMASKAMGYLTDMFSDIDSEGINLIVTQRPQTAFPDMTEDQFRQYVVFTFKGLIESLQNKKD